MQLILDKMAATIVSAIVFIILFSLQVRVQSNSAGETVSYMAKKHTLNFAEILERDLANAGFMTAPGQQAVLGYSNSVVNGVTITDSLEFWGMGNAGTQARIRYVARNIDSTYADGTTLPMQPRASLSI